MLGDKKPLTAPNRSPMLASMKSHAETFAEVYTFLFAQGRQSISNGVCRYRADDGARCAAGCLSSSSFEEGESLGHPANEAIIVEAGHDPAFVLVLQHAHDYAGDSDDDHHAPWVVAWQARMRRIAETHGIDVSSLPGLAEEDEQ